MNTKKKGRVLGVDFGDKRTGLAVSDEDRFLATGLCTVTANGLSALSEKIAETAKQYSPSEIVMGLPLNMDDTDSNRTEKTKKFAALLEEKTGLCVILQDERLTTVEAHDIMSAIQTKRKNRKNKIDTLSAELILQEYLDNERGKK